MATTTDPTAAAVRLAGGADCGSVGPRIGSQAPRCILTPGHGGDHQAHGSWDDTDSGPGPLTWSQP